MLLKTDVHSRCLRLEVEPYFQGRHERLRQRALDTRDLTIHSMMERRVYRIEASMEVQPELLEAVFVDPILAMAIWEDSPDALSPDWVVEIQYRPGVTDNEGRSAEEAIRLIGLSDVQVSTGRLWLFWGDLEEAVLQDFAQEVLGNLLIQSVDVYRGDSREMAQRFREIRLPHVKLRTVEKFYETFDVTRSLEQWLEWSQRNCWALNSAEISHLCTYFQSERVQNIRNACGLPIHPTDVEVEIIAQSWSEHCKHKIFAAEITYTEGELPESWMQLGSKKIDSLFETYIQRATEEIRRERQLPWLRSVFHDNAGVVAFDEQVDVAIKVETHNSPSALDPYGGAITGILGVNRDILGVGLGAKSIANMDVFCVAEPNIVQRCTREELPIGLKMPRELLSGVHQGVRDGGNLSGIPTVNGAFVFDQDYAGKPLIFVGTVGVMPKETPDGREGVLKEIHVGDRIVMIGGAIGADGIHGATFSSVGLDENSPSTAVQIGDPMTQKRVSDFLEEARDLGLYRGLTDNGAGGLSSSVGEMALLSNGARLDISLAPTKYPNLKPWERMVSESQERMTLAVPPSVLGLFLDLARRRGVVATDLGCFTDSGYFDVHWQNELLAHLDLSFLHDSLPKMELKAYWDGPRERHSWIPEVDRIPADCLSLEQKLCILLSSPNIASKEAWVRQYDHEVQAATIGKPFGGKTQEGPNDAGVLWLYPHGGTDESCISIACGLAPRLSLTDPYLMAQAAFDEAIRNCVATGGDIDSLCALDNFCWPDPIFSEKVPDGEYKLGQLVRCCEGLYQICKAYGVPLVSGKDSMKNDFRGRNARGESLEISVLPTLLVTAMGRTTLSRVQSAAFKQEGDLILWLGRRTTSLVGSTFSTQIQSHETSQPWKMDLKANLHLYRKVRDLLQEGLLQSVHDISDGGLLCALVECCFGNSLTARIDLDASDTILFGEGTGQFVVSVRVDVFQRVLEKLKDLDFLHIGQVCGGDHFYIGGTEIPMSTVHKAWTREF